MSATELANVIGIEVVHDGRIASGDSTRVVLDLQLRTAHRGTGDPITAVDSPVHNTAESVVEDLGGVNDVHRVTAEDDATMRLAELSIGIDVGKTFSPQTQVDPNDGPVTMTLSARPTGSARAASMVVVDDEPRFWNAFDFVDFAPTFALTSPIDRVQVDVFTGGTFSGSPGDATVTRTGGGWVNGTAGAAPALPAGVNPADVQGLRFTFTRDDGQQWENPANPLQQMPLMVQRRDDLRSGGPVENDYYLNTPAPGETERGTFTNAVTATVNSFLTNASDEPLYTDSASTEAAMHYLHEQTSVAVTKGPQGVQQPGAVIPFTLEVVNTGTGPITNPVITDRIPMDAGGPLLVFDPQLEGSPYAYALQGDAPAPPNGSPMPTDPADVTTTVAPDGSSIEFAFPDGTVLESGQTYTITILLMFRPGVTEGQQITNSFDIAADRVFDFCQGEPAPGPGEWASCADDTTVYPAAAGAMRAIKLVKADDGLGVINDVDPGASGDCAPVVDGFYEAPCVPVTKPGSTETWVVAGQNTGTIEADRVIAIDRLPFPGDSGAYVDLPRGSEWKPLWVGNVSPLDFPGGVQPESYEVYVTSDADPCVVELDSPTATCPEGAWVPWVQDPPSMDPALVTSIKIVMHFPDDRVQPGEEVAFTFQTRSPAVSPTAGPDTIAWNTVATGGSRDDSAVLPTEGRRVGVALATGPLQVVKTVSGDGAAFAPDTFEVQLQCTSAVGTPVETVLPPIDLVLTAGEPQTVEDLPWGAECELVEVAGANGETSSSSTTAVVARDTEPIGVVTLENVYELAGLTISKDVSSTAVDQAGEPVSYGPFEVQVTCRYLGDVVAAEGYAPGEPMTVTIADGDEVVLTGLPAGAACDVEETGAMDAASTSITVTAGDADPVTTEGTAVRGIVLTPIEDGAPTVLVGIENVFEVGSVSIEKVTDGPGAEFWGDGPFTLHLQCVLADDTGIRTVWDGDLVLPTPEGEWSTTVENIAAGADCRVTEPDPALADEVSVSPEGLFEVGGEPVEVTVTNTFLTGSLHVVKEREGDGAELYGAGPFTVSLSCTLPLEGGPVPVVIPGGAERVLDEENGYEADYETLPARAECELSEVATGGANAVEITDEDGEPASTFVVEPDVERSFTVTNTFTLGSIEVVKTISGSGAAEFGDRSFTVQLSCVRDVDGEGVAIEIPGGATRTLSKATSLTTVYEDLPTGAECELVETNAGGAARTTLTPHGDDPRVASVTVGEGDDVVRIDVVNEFDATPPMANTGVDPLPIALVAGGVLLVGGAVLAFIALRRRRRG
ncbi:DUF5979 domain-containing protein [Agromyces soli]